MAGGHLHIKWKLIGCSRWVEGDFRQSLTCGLTECNLNEQKKKVKGTKTGGPF